MNPDSELVSLIDTALGLPISESTLADLRAYNYAYENRFLAMSETERELAHRVDRWRDKRQAVKLAIKALREGFVPKWSVLLRSPPSPLVAIIGRYDNAVKVGDT